MGKFSNGELAGDLVWVAAGFWRLHSPFTDWAHRRFRLSDGWNDRLFGGDLNLRVRNEVISIGQRKTLVRILRNREAHSMRFG
jgi:hypothetical protein